MKITDRQVKALKPKTTRYEVWETNGKGLGLRVGPSGRKSWIYMYRFNGKTRRMTFGHYPLMRVAQAHQAHAQARSQLAKGEDPGNTLKTTRQAERQALTVDTVSSNYS